ncbi:MAG TPA: nitroreductase [Dongiaceae bacterium]|jgi:nitroreductase|nr:nitroreductase [Dongiaceae bacterium]
MSQLDRPPLPEAGVCSACTADETDRARLLADLAWMLERRSVAVKRLGDPGPDRGQLDFILHAALAAPDHGALRPWRLVRCTKESRARLAEIFVRGKLRRHPDSTGIQLEREREKALRPPVLLAVISSPRVGHAKVPEAEQVASAGAALEAILLAAHGLGFGAIILSGDRCLDADLQGALGVAAGETLLGFISIGSIVDEPKHAPRPALADVMFDFDGERVGALDLDKS